jgi:hypothetical protein
MNATNAKEFLPLVQALADGKVIQYLCKDDGRWYAADQCLFTLPPDQYRIKPEPREWDMWVTPKGVLTTNSDMLMREEVRVREILD